MSMIKKERASTVAKTSEAKTCPIEGVCANGAACCCVKKIICCLGTTIAMVFAILAFVFAYRGYQLEVLRGGGKENIEEMNKLYSSKEYVDYVAKNQKTQIDSFYEMLGTDTATVDNSETTVDASDTTAKAPKVLDKEAIAALKATGKIKGKEDAEVTILEFADVNCGFCKRQIAADKTVAAVMASHPNVNLIYKNMPVLGSVEQAQVIECVGNQVDVENYYAFVEKAYAADQTDLESLATLAETLGADKAKVISCVKDNTYQEFVNAQMSEGRSFGIGGTPASVVINNSNGKYVLIEGAYPLADFGNAITTVLS